jgi:hypothetical protein
MQGTSRAMRIAWLVALGLIALFLLDGVALKGAPFYTMVAASRARQGLTCAGSFGDACGWGVGLALTFFLLLPAVFLIAALLLISIVAAARAGRWLRLASLTVPLSLSVALVPLNSHHFYDVWRLGIDPQITTDFLIACAAAAPVLSLVYAFLPSRQRACTTAGGAAADGDAPAPPGG